MIKPNHSCPKCSLLLVITRTPVPELSEPLRFYMWALCLPMPLGFHSTMFSLVASIVTRNASYSCLLNPFPVSLQAHSLRCLIDVLNAYIAYHMLVHLEFFITAVDALCPLFVHIIHLALWLSVFTINTPSEANNLLFLPDHSCF